MSRLFDCLNQQVVNNPDRIAIVENDTRWTYGDLGEQINRLASSLSQQGIQPGHKVALMFLNQKEFVVSLFALLRIGAVAVPVNIQMFPDDIGYVIVHSETRLVLTTQLFAGHFAGKPIPILVANQTDDSQLPSFEAAIANGTPDFHTGFVREPNALSLLMYTSGTTGNPKGVMLSEENLLANLDGIEDAIHYNRDAHMLLALPLFHGFGLIIGLYAFYLGARVILVPNFAPKAIVEKISTEQVDLLPLVPTMFSVLLDRAEKLGPEPFASLKVCISGGASLPTALLDSLEAKLNVVVLEGYGLTETSPVVSVNRLETGSIAGSVGLPLNNVKLKLIDDQNQAIAWQPGTRSAEGEILIQGPNVMLGYFKAPQETSEAIDVDGWFHSGDLGHLDERGNLFISGGRKKDLIIKSGENIAPVRIEQILYQHPAVQEASVIGIPDDRRGEAILACIAFHTDGAVAENELKKHCQQLLPAHMVPDAFRIYPELPKNPSGKILKKTLRLQIAAEAPSALS